MGKMRNWRGLAVLSALSLAGAASACARVTPDELDTTLATMREEMAQQMQQGDQAVEQRLEQRLGGRITTVEQRTAALQTDLQEMEQEFEVTIQRLEDAIRFDVPVYFAFDDATVEQEDQAVLDRFGSVAREYYPEALITVEGFTDPSGTSEYNLDLGLRRAGSVREYLLSTGMAQDRVRAVSYGENTERLVAPQDTGPGMEGWENRRVVLVIDHNGQAPAIPTVTDGPLGQQ
jgi:peptidoglycan-associated lipoprotein